MKDREIRIIWEIIAIGVLAFALYNDLWAEPQPPKMTCVFMGQAADTQLTEELEVQTIERSNDGR